MRRPWKAALDYEPRIDDMLDDPVIKALMDRDGVRRGDLVDLILAVKARRREPVFTRSCCE